MKRICLMLCMLLVLIPSANAVKRPTKQQQPEKLTNAEYFSRYLDAFQALERGDSYYDKIEAGMKAEDPEAVSKGIIDQNDAYFLAMKLIPLVLERPQADVTEAFFDGVEALLNSNEKFINIIDPKTDDSKLEKEMEKVASAKEAAYEKILDSAVFLTLVVTEPPKGKNPSGPIPYRISDKERQALKDKFNKYFSRQYADAAKQIKKMDKNDAETGTITDIALVRIYETIFFNTYEELKKKALISE